jgi:hypothetical protein
MRKSDAGVCDCTQIFLNAPEQLELGLKSYSLSSFSGKKGVLMWEGMKSARSEAGGLLARPYICIGDTRWLAFRNQPLASKKRPNPAICGPSLPI